MTLVRMRKESLLHAAFAALVVLPSIVARVFVDYWPNQDGPNHLAVVHIVQQLRLGPSPFHEHFLATPRVTAYSGYYLLLDWLSRIVTLHTAERIVECLALIALPASLLFFTLRTERARAPNVYLVAPLATGWVLGMGFLGAHLGLSMGFIVLAFYWGRRGGRQADDSGARGVDLLAASALLLITAIFHPFSAATTLVCAALLEWRRVFTARGVAEFASLSTPVTAFVLLQNASGTRGPGGNSEALTVSFNTLPNAIHDFFVYTLGSFSDQEIALRFFAIAPVLFFALKGIRFDSLASSHPHASLSRLFLGVMLLGLFGPTSIMSWATINHRLAFLTIAIAAAAADVPLRATKSAALGILLSFAVASVQYQSALPLSARISTVVDVGRHIPRNATVLPLDYSTIRVASANRRIATAHHAWAYIAIERDIIGPELFATNGPFPFGGDSFRWLHFRQPFAQELTGQDVWPGDIDSQLLKDPEYRFDRALDVERLLGKVATYDRLLVLSPPPPLLRVLRRELVHEYDQADVWLFRPKVKRPTAGDDPLVGCSSRYENFFGDE